MNRFFDHLINRIRWSRDGLVATWSQEYSFRLWCLANLISMALVFILPLGTPERMILLALGLLVLVAELFNTAVERAVDHTSTERNPLAGQAKDAASAAVMLMAVIAGGSWILALASILS